MKSLWCGFAVAVVCGSVCTVSAQTVPDKNLPKRGSLSTNYTTGRTVNTSPEPFGFDELKRDEESPIAGSVSRVKEGELELKVFNNSKEDAYSVDVEVLQMDENFAVLKRDYFSYTIPAQGSKVQKVTGVSGVKGSQMNLLRWKNLTAKKRVAAKQGAQK